MRPLEDLLSENNLSNPEDIDSLLELADITRRLIRDERYSGIELLISYLIGNDAETITDHNGEVQSFFNILTYKTAYGHIFLVTEENFDTKDNDFIRYKLKFTK